MRPEVDKKYSRRIGYSGRSHMSLGSLGLVYYGQIKKQAGKSARLNHRGILLTNFLINLNGNEPVSNSARLRAVRLGPAFGIIKGDHRKHREPIWGRSINNFSRSRSVPKIKAFSLEVQPKCMQFLSPNLVYGPSSSAQNHSIVMLGCSLGAQTNRTTPLSGRSGTSALFLSKS